MYIVTRCNYPSLFVLILILVVVLLVTVNDFGLPVEGRGVPPVSTSQGLERQVEGAPIGSTLQEVGGQVEGAPIGSTLQEVGGQVEGAQIGSTLQEVGGHIKSGGSVQSLAEKIAEPSKDLPQQENFHPPKFKYISEPVTPVVDEKKVKGF